MNNIDEFNHYVALIMGDLYASFPVKKDIELSSYPSNRDDFDEAFDSMIIATSTAQFLCEEGLIKCDEINQQCVINAILSTKGLSVLSKVPISVKNKQTIGEKLTTISKATTSAASLSASLSTVAKMILNA